MWHQLGIWQNNSLPLCYFLPLPETIFMGLWRQTRLEKRRCWCQAGMYPFTQILANLVLGKFGRQCVFLEEEHFQEFKQVLGGCPVTWLFCVLYSSDTEVQMVRNQTLTMYSVRIISKTLGESSKMPKSKYMCGEGKCLFFPEKGEKSEIKGNRHISFLLFLASFPFLVV